MMAKYAAPPRSYPPTREDRFHDGIVIRFADGTMIFYGSQFLYEHRGADGNWEVADDPEAS
jgi:hypothetical protein